MYAEALSEVRLKVIGPALLAASEDGGQYEVTLGNCHTLRGQVSYILESGQVMVNQTILHECDAISVGKIRTERTRGKSSVG